nr:MAG TPA: hypothetical protein [Bacteriophage sp.]
MIFDVLDLPLNVIQHTNICSILFGGINICSIFAS